MTASLLSVAASLVLLYLGAEALVRGSAALALRLGLTPLVVGLTVVAFGTSSPELVVSVKAALDGTSDVALGNVVGSNVANIALILGAAAVIRPLAVEAKVVRLDVPVMIGTSVLLALLLLDGRLGRAEGLLLAGGALAYTGFSVWAARRETSREVLAEFVGGVPSPGPSAGREAGLVALGLVLLVFGGKLLVDGAVTIASALGVGQALIGLTIVAVGTSLPELATSAVASWRGQADIAVGNVVGSNIFNVLGILGTASLVEPLAPGGVGPVDLAVMLGAAALTLPVAWSGFRVSRAEGAVLLAGYVAYLGYLITA